MSLKSGRVGVHPTEVKRNGKIKDGAGISPETQAKIDRAILIPITTPTEELLTGVDTGKSQIMVKIGAGLKLEGTTSPYTLTIDTEYFERMK